MEGWPIERLVYLFLAAGYLLVWLQLTLYHWRGAFRHWAMWGPVLYTPILVIAAAAMAFADIGMLFVVAYVFGALEGLAGTYYHFKGIAAQVGGLNLRNSTTGPPPLLPIIYAALSGFGLLVYYWPSLTGGAQ